MSLQNYAKVMFFLEVQNDMNKFLLFHNYDKKHM